MPPKAEPRAPVTIDDALKSALAGSAVEPRLDAGSWTFRLNNLVLVPAQTPLRQPNRQHCPPLRLAQSADSQWQESRHVDHSPQIALQPDRRMVIPLEGTRDCPARNSVRSSILFARNGRRLTDRWSRRQDFRQRLLAQESKNTLVCILLVQHCVRRAELLHLWLQVGQKSAQRIQREPASDAPISIHVNGSLGPILTLFASSEPSLPSPRSRSCQSC